MSHFKPGDIAQIIGPEGQNPLAYCQVAELCPHFEVERGIYHVELLTSAKASITLEGVPALLPELLPVYPLVNLLVAGSQLHVWQGYLKKLEEIAPEEEGGTKASDELRKETERQLERLARAVNKLLRVSGGLL